MVDGQSSRLNTGASSMFLKLCGFALIGAQMQQQGNRATRLNHD